MYVTVYLQTDAHFANLHKRVQFKPNGAFVYFLKGIDLQASCMAADVSFSWFRPEDFK